MTNANHTTPPLTVEEEGTILALWRCKLDTVAIAEQVRRPEWQVANRLRQLRDAEKQVRG